VAKVGKCVVEVVEVLAGLEDDWSNGSESESSAEGEFGEFFRG
jgi:hypothetical protein